MIMSQNNSPHTEDILLQGAKSYLSVSDDISAIVEAKTSRTWWLCMGVSLAFLAWGGYCMYLTLTEGIGVWGLNKTVGWAWDITNFVWWVGIGHAGTLISAVLLLFRQKWRLAINRSAEAMTIFAVLQASIFPIIHMGRPWKVTFQGLPICMNGKMVAFSPAKLVLPSPLRFIAYPPFFRKMKSKILFRR